MEVLRTSYSFLSQWAQGRHQDALLSYFHVPRPTPPHYVEGKKWDDYCQEYIGIHKKLPPEWGGDRLLNPVIQWKQKVQYNEFATLTGVFDIYDRKTKILYELKSGHSLSARSYAGGYQVPLYLLLCDRLSIPATEGRIIRYNAKEEKSDTAILYPSSRLLKKAENYLDSLIPEIHQYFLDNNLFTLSDTSVLERLQK